MSLKNIDFFKYLPFENSKYYYLPLVNTISTKSFLFHSKMISNIVRSHILKMNKSFNLKPGDLVSTSYIIDEERKKTLHSELIYNELPNLTINLTNNSLSAWMDLSIDKLNKRGYKTSFKASNSGFLISSCGLNINPKDMIIDKIYRFEVETDMDEEAILFVLDCPKYKIRGTYLVPFGNKASSLEANIIKLFKK